MDVSRNKWAMCWDSGEGMTVQSGRLISSSPDCWYPQMHSTDSVLHSGPSAESQREIESETERETTRSWKSCETKKKRGEKTEGEVRERWEGNGRESERGRRKNKEESLRERELCCRLQILIPSTSSLVLLFIPVETFTLLLTSAAHTDCLRFNVNTTWLKLNRGYYENALVRALIPTVQTHVSLTFSEFTG